MFLGTGSSSVLNMLYIVIDRFLMSIRNFYFWRAIKRQLYSEPFALRKAVCNKGQMHDLKQLYGEPISCTTGSRQY